VETVNNIQSDVVVEQNRTRLAEDWYYLSIKRLIDLIGVTVK